MSQSEIKMQVFGVDSHNFLTKNLDQVWKHTKDLSREFYVSQDMEQIKSSLFSSYLHHTEVSYVCGGISIS